MTELRPLGIVKEMVEETGLEISYAYDDLVFVDHSLLIIRFSENDIHTIELFFNSDIESSTRKDLLTKIIAEAEKREMVCINKGFFSLKEQSGKEQLQISFYEENN